MTSKFYVETMIKWKIPLSYSNWDPIVKAARDPQEF